MTYDFALFLFHEQYQITLFQISMSVLLVEVTIVTLMQIVQILLVRLLVPANLAGLEMAEIAQVGM